MAQKCMACKISKPFGVRFTIGKRAHVHKVAISIVRVSIWLWNLTRGINAPEPPIKFSSRPLTLNTNLDASRFGKVIFYLFAKENKLTSLY